MDTTNKSILLTGASGGIGREIALAFAKSGGKPVLAGRNKDALEDVRASVEQAGGQAIIFPGDVTNADGRKTWFKKPPKPMAAWIFW